MMMIADGFRIDWLGETVTGMDGAIHHASLNKFSLFCKSTRNSTKIHVALAIGFRIRCITL